MKKLILAAVLAAPLSAPALAQIEATPSNTVTQYQTQGPREFTARRISLPAAPASQQQGIHADRQGPAGNF